MVYFPLQYAKMNENAFERSGKTGPSRCPRQPWKDADALWESAVTFLTALRFHVLGRRKNLEVRWPSSEETWKQQSHWTGDCLHFHCHSLALREHQETGQQEPHARQTLLPKGKLLAHTHCLSILVPGTCTGKSYRGNAYTAMVSVLMHTHGERMGWEWKLSAPCPILVIPGHKGKQKLDCENYQILPILVSEILDMIQTKASSKSYCVPERSPI